VVCRYHRYPARGEELRPQRLDVGRRIFARPGERIAAYVDALEALDQVFDRGTVGIAIVPDDTARELQQRRSERDVDRLGRPLREGGEIRQPQAARIRRGGEGGKRQERARQHQGSKSHVSLQRAGSSSTLAGELSGVGIFLTGYGRAHDVDAVAGDAQRLQELRTSLIRARHVESVPPHLHETHARNETGGERHRQPARAQCGAAPGGAAGSGRRRTRARIEPRYDLRGKVFSGALRTQGTAQRPVELISHGGPPVGLAAAAPRSGDVTAPASVSGGSSPY